MGEGTTRQEMIARMRTEFELAITYAEDGAFASAGRTLKRIGHDCEVFQRAINKAFRDMGAGTRRKHRRFV